MARFDTFTFRVSQDERRLIHSLALSLQRSQSDTIRLVIREAAQGLGVRIQEDKETSLASEARHAEAG